MALPVGWCAGMHYMHAASMVGMIKVLVPGGMFNGSTMATPALRAVVCAV